MRISFIAVGAAVALSGAFASAQDPQLTALEHLKEPKISTKKKEKMLVVEAKGDPTTVGAKAFSLVFRLYYTMPETPKAVPLAPRARWPLSFDTPRAEWRGLYALPVPDSVTRVPPHEAQEGLKASLAIWEYGDMAEILHIGPYSKEEPTIKRLTDFVKRQGYAIAGDHEEEYIKGPTMSGPGDPEKYVTIIRYPVRKN